MIAGIVLAAVFAVPPASGQAPRDAAPRQNRSHTFGPGECGRADPTYIHIANETGGQPFFLNPSEVGKAFHFVRETSGTSGETLLWSAGAFEAAAVQEFEIPIDSTIRRVTFALSVDTSGSDLAVFDPGGAAVTVADHRTEITVLNCGRIVTIDAPPAGTWRLRVGGVGRFWLTAHARSDITFATAEFVRRGGRPGHEGLFEIDGQPLAGAPAMLRAWLGRNGSGAASFDLVSLRGDPILALASADDPDASSEDFVSTFDLPSQPFRVRARGVDTAGHRFQRVFHTLFHAETVEVTPPAPLDDLAPGTSTPLAFRVRNVGGDATFRIIAADGRRFVTRFEPRVLTLEAGAAAIVTVWVTIPPDAAAGTGSDLTVTATSESGPQTTNGASAHVSVSAPRE